MLGDLIEPSMSFTFRIHSILEFPIIHIKKVIYSRCIHSNIQFTKRNIYIRGELFNGHTMQILLTNAQNSPQCKQKPNI